jgi:hypothetical protein
MGIDPHLHPIAAHCQIPWNLVWVRPTPSSHLRVRRASMGAGQSHPSRLSHPVCRTRPGTAVPVAPQWESAPPPSHPVPPVAPGLSQPLRHGCSLCTSPTKSGVVPPPPHRRKISVAPCRTASTAIPSQGTAVPSDPWTWDRIRNSQGGPTPLSQIAH